MEKLNLNKILEREELIQSIKDIIHYNESDKKNITYKRGIYIYGTPGCGKTEFVIQLLNSINYDIIKYDTSDIRNKNVIETLKKDNMSDKNIISLFNKKTQLIAIMMDEIDGMNNGDKGGITSLIKLIRPKKTKKQKLEDRIQMPLICISNYYTDKKINELMKVCNTFELKKPTDNQIKTIINYLMPNLNEDIIIQKLINYIQGDLRKVNEIYKIYKINNCILINNIENIFNVKSYNNNVKDITQSIIKTNYNIKDHLKIMNDTDRTIVGLLWHENIIDYISKYDNELSVPLYLKILDNICFADYIDRITFQKQIWQFNEMSSLIKTFHNNNLYHSAINNMNPNMNPNMNNAVFNQEPNKSHNIRFTKVLTKYSTEYNNYLFIQEIGQKLSLDKKDIISLFISLRNKSSLDDIYILMDPYEINKLDINRLYRYIDKMLVDSDSDNLPINKKNNEDEEYMLYDDYTNYNNYTILEDDDMNDTGGYIE
jgi:hypothetical protein